MSSTEEILTIIEDMIDSIASTDPYTAIDIDHVKLDDLYTVQSALEDLYEILTTTTQSVEDLSEDVQDRIDELEEHNGEPPKEDDE